MDRLESLFKPLMWSMALLMVALLAGCGGGSMPFVPNGATIAPGTQGTPAGSPTVVSSSPSNGATNVPTSTNNSNNVVTGKTVTATFSQAMNPATINSSSFTLKETTGNNVPGTVTMDSTDTVATFTPSAPALKVDTNYTATVTMAAKSTVGIPMTNPVAWSFTTKAVVSSIQAPINLGAAGTFAILTKSGITDVPTSKINGDVGTSPVTGAANRLTCVEVITGKVYSDDATGPLPCNIVNPTLLTTAIGDMQLAYTDAAGRVLPDFTELGAGEIGGLTLAPGLYKWSSDLSISTNVTLSGGPNDVWIFQIAGNFAQADATRVNLIGGALAKNIFWQSGGSVAIGTTAHFEGVLLVQTNIAVKTGASVNGRLFAQTAVSLQQNAVTQPAK
jgi:hypothetical protein